MGADGQRSPKFAHGPANLPSAPPRLRVPIRVLQSCASAVTKRRLELKEREMDYTNLIAKTEGAVGVITLNRPKALNALNSELLGELCNALEVWDADENVHCIVLTG